MLRLVEYGRLTQDGYLIISKDNLSILGVALSDLKIHLSINSDYVLVTELDVLINKIITNTRRA